MNKQIAVLPGDGIGPEIIDAAVLVIDAIADRFDHKLDLKFADIGGIAIDNYNNPLPDETVALCKAADAVLLGAVGGPKWSDPQASIRPEQGLLGLRGALDLFANLRPVKPHPSVLQYSPLKESQLEGVDFIIVRELTGGIYFGEHVESNSHARDVCEYSADEVRRVVRVAARLASERNGRLLSVDKANVLATSRLWRTVTTATINDEFPGIELEHMLVDAAAMYMIQRPSDFDVMVTENLFGDILTDEASVITGSIGLLPSASLNSDGKGLYEPIHGSAPDIAGQGIANPYGTLASVAMMLKLSLGMPGEAAALETAMDQCLRRGIFTPDLVQDGSARTTMDVAEEIVSALTVQAVA